MKIIQHYHHGEVLQRSVVEYNGITCLRLVHWVHPTGELNPATIPEGALWNEQENGSWSRVSTSIARTLEREFIKALIVGNRPESVKTLTPSRYFDGGDRVYHFPAGSDRGTAYFPPESGAKGSGTVGFWSIPQMAQCEHKEISFAQARIKMPHIPA